MTWAARTLESVVNVSQLSTTPCLKLFNFKVIKVVIISTPRKIAVSY